MINLDGKFSGVIVRNSDGKVIPPDRYVVFLVTDNAFPPTLEFYRQECERIGAGNEQLAAVDRLSNRVKQWRMVNHELLKVPDAEPGECH